MWLDLLHFYYVSHAVSHSVSHNVSHFWLTCQSHIFHSLFIISAYTLYGKCSRLMMSSLFYSSNDIIWHHYCVLLHHDHAIAHHSFIIHANGLLIDSLWSLYALYGIFYVYKDKQSFTYKYRVLHPGMISSLTPQSVITYNKHSLASILNSIVSSVLSHWVLPHYAVVSAPFEKLRSRKVMSPA